MKTKKKPFLDALILGCLSAAAATAAYAAEGNQANNPHSWAEVPAPPSMLDPGYRLFGATTENALRAVESNGLRTVVVGSRGTVAFSDTIGTPLPTWTPGVLSSLIRNAHVFDVAYSNGTWVAVTGPGGQPVVGKLPKQVFTLRSTDGAFWTVTPRPHTPEVQNLRAVAASGSGTWIATGGGGWTLRSVDDGRAWSLVSVTTAGSVTGIAYFQGAWYAGVYDNTPDASLVFRSFDDGQTWSQVTRLSQSINALDVVNGRLMALGNQSAVSTSINGTAWTRNFQEPADLGMRHAVHSSATGYVVGGEGGLLLTSRNLNPNGWRYGALPTTGFINDLHAVGGNRVMAVTSNRKVFLGVPK